MASFGEGAADTLSTKAKKKKKFGDKDSRSIGAAINPAAFADLQTQVDAIQNGGTFATQTDVANAVAAQTALQATIDAAQEAAQVVTDAAQDAAAVAEEAADAIQEADTDSEQAAQDGLIAGNTAAIALNTAAVGANTANIAALDSAVTQAQSDITDRVIRAGDTMTGPLVGIQGGAAAPSIGVGAADTGLYSSIASTRIGVSLGGILNAEFTTSTNSNDLTINGKGTQGARLLLNNNDNSGSVAFRGPVEPLSQGSYVLRLPPDRAQIIGETLANTNSILGGATTHVMDWSDSGLRHQNDGDNLFWNGRGWRGDAENWAVSGSNPHAWDPVEKSFTFTDNINGINFSSEFFPIDPTRNITASYERKAELLDHRFYFALTFFDVDKETIDVASVLARVGTETTLAQVFTPGDTVMHLTDASSWIDYSVPSPHTTGIAFAAAGGAEDVNQKIDNTLGSYHYTRYVGTDPADLGNYTVDFGLNTLNFPQPFSAAKMFFNGTDPWPVGTVVRQPFTRAPYMYKEINVLSLVSDGWIHKELTWATPFPNPNVLTYDMPATARFAKVIILPHRSTGGALATSKLRNIYVRQS